MKINLTQFKKTQSVYRPTFNEFRKLKLTLEDDLKCVTVRAFEKISPFDKYNEIGSIMYVDVAELEKMSFDQIYEDVLEAMEIRKVFMREEDYN